MNDFKWTYYKDVPEKVAKHGTVSDEEYEKILTGIWNDCDQKQKDLFSKLYQALRPVFPILDELRQESNEEQIISNMVAAATGIGNGSGAFPVPSGGIKTLPHLQQTAVERHLNEMR